jgi:hypothetical protein
MSRWQKQMALFKMETELLLEFVLYSTRLLVSPVPILVLVRIFRVLLAMQSSKRQTTVHTWTRKLNKRNKHDAVEMDVAYINLFSCVTPLHVRLL